MSLLIATQDTFTKAGRFVSRGQTVSSEEVDYNEDSENLMEAPTGIDKMAVVEVSAIAPTGPNPKNPQQIAPDVVQTVEGYVQSGAVLVGEVTLPEKQRIEIVGIDKDDDTQAKVQEALADNDRKGSDLSNEPVNGSVSEVNDRLDGATSEQIDEIEAAEKEREMPRKGVMAAIDKARAAL